MTRHLLVPGRNLPRPEHWMNRWADAHPDYRWAPRPPGPPFVVEERVAALHDAIVADDEPAVLIAHSAGCLAVVTWAVRHTGPVRAALLATPPYLDPEWMPGPHDVPDDVPWIMPRQRLPFRTVVVASRNDPAATFEQVRAYAEDWGAELYDAGDAGHLNTDAGYGPWPAGERLVADLDGDTAGGS